MPGAEPIAEAASVGFAATASTPWAVAASQLETARNYWLTTVRPDGQPHVAPVWGVWLDNVLYFSTGATSRKARNLAREPRCAFSVEAAELHLVVEGSATRVSDEAKLHRVVAVYAPKYNYPMEVRNGGIEGEGGGGPVFAVTPAVAFAFDAGEVFSATRYRF